MYACYKMHKEMELKYPQYKSIDGDRNIWISKPSYNARGVGIFCFNKASDVLQGAVKKQMCPKIVQKYIERPFLLKMD